MKLSIAKKLQLPPGFIPQFKSSFYRASFPMLAHACRVCS